MIYSVGIPKLSGVTMEPLTEKTKLHSEDVVLIDAIGQRCIWDKVGKAMQLQAIVPTHSQEDEIKHFLEHGGQIYTSMVDPFKSQEVFATVEEVKTYAFQPPYVAIEEEKLVRISVPPYNWVPREYVFVPVQAYELFQAAKNQTRRVEHPHLTYIVGQSISSLTYRVGEHQGSITFSTLISGSMKQQDVSTLLEQNGITQKEQVGM